MQEITISSEELVTALLKISEKEQVCLLDSCGVSHLDSKFLIAGIKPLEVFEISDDNYERTLEFLDEKLSNDKLFAFFTMSYEFGLKINRIKSRHSSDETDLFLALFDSMIIHNYNTKKTYLHGNENRFDGIKSSLLDFQNLQDFPDFQNFQDFQDSKISTNFTHAEYLEKIEEIKEFIRCGDTYQTNLTQQITAELPEILTPQQIFYNLRKNHPAPFAAFLQRQNSTVVSASPERFFKVQSPKSKVQSPIISTSPIKGTRPRGKTLAEDEKLKKELLSSEKDRAENVMIVDLLRNDIGRICKFGSVEVEKLCDLETHPTLFHLTSTINGNLQENIKFSDIIKAVFPCGSITGAPKISTMRIIDNLETAPRGLSMGAIGFKIQDSRFQIQNSEKILNLESEILNFTIDLSVAIRTMTIKNNRATFNVGGGILIDSEPKKEYEETLIKAKALLKAINGRL
ncbi:MAG TPA: anthranilate synthase component I family protein [Pyrinomonadaceae bacterium]|nr:anthranilate synthase component I family protein [Pyrinomonadaceae bacterium]